MATESSPTSEPKSPKLRWYQYRLRSLFILTTLVAIACSWLAVKMQRVRGERASVATVEKLHGMAWRDYQANGFGDPEHERPLSEPQFLLDWLGIDFFHPVVGVTFSTGELRKSGWGPRTRISEHDLFCFDGLVNLKVLDLSQQPIGDKTLVYIRKFSYLERLDVTGTFITDAGLANLWGLNQLSHLRLGNTKVTDQGIKKLQQALPKCKIER
jgi:hypothetical protein